MRKRYLVSEDKYSGQVVIICETREIMQERLINPEQVMYLYDEPIYEELGFKTLYTVKAFYHYEQGETDEGLLYWESTYNKNEANEFFKTALILTR